MRASINWVEELGGMNLFFRDWTIGKADFTRPLKGTNPARHYPVIRFMTLAR